MEKARKVEKARALIAILKADSSSADKVWKEILKEKDGIFKAEMSRLSLYFKSNYDVSGKFFDDLNFTEEEIEMLKTDTDEKGPSAKLFKAMAWKNGDNGKDLKIIEGLLNTNDEVSEENQKVFFQFGRFLRSYSVQSEACKYEPIMDQHTFRAYLALKDRPERIFDTIPADVAGTYWNDYRAWYKKTVKKNGNDKDAFWKLNHVMFVLGKAIKE
jgi:hypothetical protein